MKMDGAEIIVTFLKEAGILTGFGVGGGYVDPLLFRIKKSGLNFNVASRESGAAFAADGYARVSKKPAFVVTTAGPGETNTITSVANANADSVPMFLITGHVPMQNMGKNAFQDNSILSHNITEIYTRITKSSFFVYSTESLFDLLRLSLLNMLGGRRGPVHLTVPYDVQTRKSDVSMRDFDLTFLADKTVSCDTAHMDMLVSHLEKNNGVLVIAGNGVLQADAISQFGAFVDGFDLHYITTPKAKSLCCISPERYLGTIGLGGTASPAVIEGFDTVVILGSSLSELSYIGCIDRVKSVKTIFQIDIDHQEIAKIIHHVYGIVGHLKCILGRLNDKRRKSVLRLPRLPAKGVSVARAVMKKPEHAETRFMHPGAFLERLSEMLPASATYFADSGSAIPFSVHYLTMKRPDSFHIPLNFAPMGWAIGAAIGAAVTAKDEKSATGPFVCITGEHSFLMEGFEVMQAVRYNLPVIFVVLNNGIYNMPYHRQRELYGEELYSSFPRFELAPAMKTLGLKVFRIDELTQLSSKLVDKLSACDCPCFVEAFVDPNALIPAANVMNTKDGKGVADDEQIL